jgi:TolB protein
MKYFLLILCLLAATVSAEMMKLTVTQGHADPMPIAIPVFQGTTDREKEMGAQITAIIKADLESTGLFYVIPPESFIEQHIPFNIVPRFQDWKIIKAQALVNGYVKFSKKGQISVGARLWDIFSESEMKDAAAAFQTDEKFWRRIAHIIADMIYKRLTGEEGYFDTRIVYVNKAHMDGKNLARLAIMDQDGANHKLLTNGEEPVMSPRFAPSMQKIAYMTFVRGEIPKVFVLDLETGKQQLVGAFPGLTFAPRFSPASDKLIMSQALNGSSSLYELHLKSGKAQRLTNIHAIDTSPSYSPDGKQIIFNSDRSGSQHLFVMDENGGNVKRISFGQGVKPKVAFEISAVKIS